MSQFVQLLNTLQKATIPLDKIIMVTVVAVKGSAYRQPGARMLVMPLGHPIGMISGGCLEKEICKKADWLTRNTNFALQRYSTGSIEHYDMSEAYFEHSTNEEEIFAFGLGCNGVVTVLFERLVHATASPLMSFFASIESSQRAGGMATIIDTPANHPFKVGDRVFLDPITRCTKWITNIPLSPLTEQLVQKIGEDLAFTLTLQRNTTHSYTTREGMIEVFYEYLPPPYRLVIFGAGPDIYPLITLAKLQSWQVTVVDSRPQYAQTNRFPEADRVLCLPLDDTFDITKITSGAAVAVMSHSLIQDRGWLKKLLLNPPPYIGQLGPRYRTERLLREITQQMSDPCLLETGKEVLHYPIGLDIGGNTPESIALAILAEIMAVMNKRNGKMLKKREISIHDE